MSVASRGFYHRGCVDGGLISIPLALQRKIFCIDETRTLLPTAALLCMSLCLTRSSESDWNSHLKLSSFTPIRPRQIRIREHFVQFQFSDLNLVDPKWSKYSDIASVFLLRTSVFQMLRRLHMIYLVNYNVAVHMRRLFWASSRPTALAPPMVIQWISSSHQDHNHCRGQDRRFMRLIPPQIDINLIGGVTRGAEAMPRRICWHH